MDSAVARPHDSDTPDPSIPVSYLRGAPLTSFIGRQQDIAGIVSLLERGHRLVTVTGPGGVGKTRLALAVTAELERRPLLDRELAFVGLAPVAEESLVIPTIARSLGVVAEDERAPVERLAAALRGRPLLLVLDNLEHVVGAATELSRLLNAVPDLTMLTTSRRALRLIGEQEYPLAPLAVPNVERQVPLERLAETAAVSLFVVRATAANPAFSLTESNATAVAQICARLDGLPLAIELAAARVKLMSPQALLARLSGRLKLLTTGPRDVPLRQQTLRDAIAWSYDLLSPEEQALFRRLSVFTGGFTLEAAEAVAGGEEVRGRDGQGNASPPVPLSPLPPALDGIAALVDHSLLVQDEGVDGEPRFRMLETIREFALSALEDANELAATRYLQARHLLELAEHMLDPAYTSEEAVLLRRLEPELDNFRASLTWLLDASDAGSNNAMLGLRLAVALTRFWDTRGYLTEERDWLHRALDRVPRAETPAHGLAYTALGVNYWFSEQQQAAEEWQQKALDLWRALGDDRNVVQSLWFLAMIAAKHGDAARLDELAAEAAPLAPHIGVTLWQMVPQSVLALAALTRRDGRRARALFESTLEFHARHNFQWPHAWVLGMVAESARIAGEREDALRFSQQSLAEFNVHGDIYGQMELLSNIAHFAIAFGQAETAARILGSVASIRPAVGKRITWGTISEFDTTSEARQALGDAAFDNAFGRGREMSIPDAVALALSVAPAPAPQPALTDPAPTHRPDDAIGLSPRELEVMRLLVDGKSNEEIGEALYISPRTASTHVANILGKLNVSSRAAAVAVALKQQLV